MPGICGILAGVGTAPCPERLALMAGALSGGSDDQAGTHVDPSLGFGVGWTASRRNLVDGLPIWNEKRTCGLVFLGEYPVEKDQVTWLKRRSHVIRNADASVLVHLYEEFGEGFVERLEGPFLGVLWDANENKVLVFCDRFGLRSFYSREEGGCIYFASEAKSLLAVCPSVRAVAPARAARYVIGDPVSEAACLFEGIDRSAPGSVLRQTGGGAHRDVRRYFDPQGWENQTLLDDSFLAERVRDRLIRILPKYLRKERGLSFAVSGGIGSEMLFRLAELPRGDLKCYTIGGSGRDSEDVAVASARCAELGLDHRVMRLDAEYLTGFPGLATRVARMSEGLASVTDAAHLYLAGQVSSLGAATLTGLFCGAVMQPESVAPPTPRGCPALADGLDGCSANTSVPSPDGRDGRSPLAGIFGGSLREHAGMLTILQAYVDVRCPFLDLEFLQVLFRARSRALACGWLGRQILAFDDGKTKEPQRRLAYSPRRRAPWWDLGGFAAGLRYAADARTDLGDAAVPGGVAHRIPQALLASRAAGTHRHTHYRDWYRRELAGFVREVLLDGRSLGRDYIRRQGVETVVEEHISGRRDWTAQISRLLTLELVQREVMASTR